MNHRFCTQCGTTLPKEGNFCPQCGAPMEDATARPASALPAQPSVQSPEQPTEQLAAHRKNGDAKAGVSRTVLYGLGTVTVIAALLVAVYFGFLRPTGVDSDCGDTPCTVDQAEIPDVHDEEGIPYPEVSRTTVDEALERFEEGKAIFLDVRDWDSYTTMHIPNAVWMPLGDLNARYSELPKDAQIITYCT